MSIPTLDVGALASTKTVTLVEGIPKVDEVSLTYKPPKGMRFVFLFLGAEAVDKPLTIKEAQTRMNALGWYLKPDKNDAK